MTAAGQRGASVVRGAADAPRERALWQVVDDEARHDWLANRPPEERPEPYEYQEDRRDHR